MVHRGLIAPDMNILRGEELYYFVEDILKETEGRLLTNTHIRGIKGPLPLTT